MTGDSRQQARRLTLATDTTMGSTSGEADHIQIAMLEEGNGNGKQTAAPAPAPLKLGNPAVVGLGGFALTTFVLQLHNLGVCGVGPVVSLGLVFGGGAQLVAGLMEQVTGNSFGFCAFTGYGAFWIALSILLLFKRYEVYEVTNAEMGCFLIGYTIFTFILWIASIKRSKMELALFSTLLLGFILLVIEKFTESAAVLKVAAWDLIGCALIAFYCMGHAVLIEVFDRDILPLGHSVLKNAGPEGETVVGKK